MKMSARNLLFVSAAIAPFVIGAPVFAADQAAAPQPAASQPGASTLGEIVVTAQRRSENLQAVPIAVTAVSAKDLAAQNITSVQNLTTLVSGFTGPGDNGMTSPHIRGIGGTVASPGEENSVALYVDGIYIGATSPALLSLGDVQQAEVLKGPQGTLFGRNTTGGLIQITTRDPSTHPELDAEVGYASYNTVSGSAYLNTPVTSNISTNLAVQASHQGDGYGKNLLTGKDSDRTDLNLTLRNKWAIRLGDATKFDITADYELTNDAGLGGRPIAGSTTAYYNPPGVPGAPAAYTSQVSGWDTNTHLDSRDHTEAYGLAGRFSQDLGFATLSDTLAFRRTRFNLLAFGDTTPLQHLQVYWYTANSQWTNELQLASNSTGPLKWTAGVFYYDATDNTHQPIFFTPGSPGNPPFHEAITDDSLVTKSLAGYAQVDYKLATDTTLTAGFRYSSDKHSINGGQVGFFGPAPTPLGPPVVDSFTRTAAVWRLALTQKLSDDAMVYASYNRGVKAGGYNPVVVGNAPFLDEKLDAFEVGSKLSFLEDHARLNLAGFYNTYKNIQVQAFQPAGPPIIYNGAGAETYGLDADLELRPLKELTINGTLELLHSKFSSFPNANILIPLPLGGFQSTTASAAGNQLPFAPKLTSSVSATYNIPVSYGSYDVSGAWSHSSGFTTTPGMEVRQGSYDLLSAQVQFTDAADHYYVRLWGTNLGNAQVDQNLTISANGSSVRVLPPRTGGVTVGLKFR
jgi:iron complex outermembrane receptor protein